MDTQLPAERALSSPPEIVDSGAAVVYPADTAGGFKTPDTVLGVQKTIPIEEAETVATAKPPMKLRLATGPISPRERSRILDEYTCLNQRRVPIQTFIRCTEKSPEGPAIHAILETTQGVIVGHCCLVPFRMNVGRRRLTVAKAEYFFISEEYRWGRVEGFEDCGKPVGAVLLEQLFQCGLKQGWGPLLAASSADTQIVYRMAGCQLVEFPVTECFFVLNPVRAWQWGACLAPKQRKSLVLHGLAQWAFSSVVLPFTYDAGLVRNPRIGETLPSSSSRDDNRLSLAEAEDFLRWRYPNEAYSRFVMSDGTPGYVIVQKGGHGEYLRVHQSRAPGNGQTNPLITELIRQADWGRALGVRWCVYGKGREQDHLVANLRKLGFSCVPRVRRVAVYSSDPEFLSPEKWNLSDSVFTLESLYPESAVV